jgi:hypothetical protein
MSVEDLMEQIDFWLSDRAADCDVLLDTLGVEEEKRLKCCQHVILTIDEAINKVFIDTESMIGRDQLAGVSIGTKAYQSTSSIVTLGLIAIAKCLSPSHAALSYSLYMDYKNWREENNLVTKDFKGFKSRFGRIASLASLFLVHKEDLVKYFSENIDENSNKLVLALSAYFKSEWFSVGREVYKVFEAKLIKPICLMLGIDDYGKVEMENRNWIGVQEFYKEKVKEMKDLSDNEKVTTNIERLVAAYATKIVENMECQLDKMVFFRDEVDENTVEKMTHPQRPTAPDHFRAGQSKLPIITAFETTNPYDVTHRN